MSTVERLECGKVPGYLPPEVAEKLCRFIEVMNEYDLGGLMIATHRYLEYAKKGINDTLMSYAFSPDAIKDMISLVNQFFREIEHRLFFMAVTDIDLKTGYALDVAPDYCIADYETDCVAVTETPSGPAFVYAYEVDGKRKLVQLYP